MPLTPNKTIFVDVDGTLMLANGELNERLLKWIDAKLRKGFQFSLRSMRGAEHALNTATKFNVSNRFLNFLSKPGAIVDDHGWRWIKFSKAIPLSRICKL